MSMLTFTARVMFEKGSVKLLKGNKVYELFRFDKKHNQVVRDKYLHDLIDHEIKATGTIEDHVFVLHKWNYIGLTDIQLIELFAMLNSGERIEKIAKKFSLSRQRVYQIQKGEAYTDETKRLDLSYKPSEEDFIQYEHLLVDKYGVTDNKVIEMRVDFSTGEYTYPVLAEKYDLPVRTTKMIVDGTIFKHLFIPLKPTIRGKARFKVNQRHLSDLEAIEIRNAYDNEEVSIPDLCERFNTTKGVIVPLINNRTYLDLPLSKKKLMARKSTRKSTPINMIFVKSQLESGKSFHKIAKFLGLSTATLKSRWLDLQHRKEYK